MDNYVSTTGVFTPSTGSRFEITPERRNLLLYAGAAGAGAAQTILIRKYLDATPPAIFSTFAFLGSFGKPSSLIPIAAGIAGLAAGLFVVRDPKIKGILVSYSGGSIVTGILSGANLI